MTKVEWLNILSKANIAVNDSVRSVPGADAYTFYKGKLYTFNGYIAITQPVDVDWNFRLKANTFHKALQSLEGDVLFLTVTESEVILKGEGRKSYKLPILYSKQIPTDISSFEVEKDKPWEPLDPLLYKKITTSVIDKLPTVSQITGVLLRDKYLYSTDDMAIIRTDLAKPIEDTWLDKPVIKALKGRSLDFLELCNCSAFLHIKIPEGVLSLRKLDSREYAFDSINKPLQAVDEMVKVPPEGFKAWFVKTLNDALPFADSLGDVLITTGETFIISSLDKQKGLVEDSFPYTLKFGQYKLPVLRALDLLKRSFDIIYIQDTDNLQALVLKSDTMTAILGIDKLNK